MRRDENYLRELELWPLYEIRPQWLPQDEPRAAEGGAAVRTAAATSTAAPSGAVRRPPPVAAPAAPIAPVIRPVDPERAARIATQDWAALAQEAAGCQACGLCAQRKQAVFGVGATEGSWLLVGEGPGADEDAQGEPFVGQAGKLLDAMLAAAGLQRGREVYIANVVKCRPPGNRTPTLDEAAQCAPFLDRQIDLIQPKLIVALGKTAAIRLTGSEASMASLRGKRHEYRGIPVVATYHPAYLLRNLPDKIKAWEDLMFAREVIPT